MMNKKIIQIESYDSDDFMDSLVEKLTQRIKEECDCCNEADTASKEWMTTKEACDYFKVSQPTLKRLRERGEVENRRVGKSFRYLRL
jgi:excisionase family DNA binding protein